MQIFRKLKAILLPFRADQQSRSTMTEAVSPYAEMMFRPRSRCLQSPVTFTTGHAKDDKSLISRIIRAYQNAQALSPDEGSFWSSHFGGVKAPIHTAFIEGDLANVSQILRNPASNNLFYGFDGPYLLGAACGEIDDDTKALYYDLLLRLGEALAAMPLEHAETPIEQRPALSSVDVIIARIEAKLGILVSFPNIYPDDQGLSSFRGAVTWRPLQAVFQAFTIASRLAESPKKRVVEIGAGLGRTAYYSSAFGISDYTIVDLPLTNAAQAYFLGVTLGEDRISLYGEPHRAGAIRIIPPENFHADTCAFDLAINVDSFTEMSRETAAGYIAALAKRAPRLISINHEANPFAISDLCAGLVVERKPYWMRQGYVMETIQFPRRGN